MKKSELKTILKPLVKECIKEVMFEDGVLSSIISEVARGMKTIPTAPMPAPVDPILERMQKNAFTSEQSTKLKEHKSKLMAAIGGDAYNGVNLFEGTSPAAAQASSTQMASPLADQAPGNSGVDISNLFGTVKRNWGAHMNEVKKGK